MIAPSDKSISHRSAIFNAISEGTSYIQNYSDGDDCISTLKLLQKLGVKITVLEEKQSGLSLKIEGIGKELFSNKNLELNSGNSGTTMRLMSGVLSSRSQGYVLTGDNSLCSRPMNRIIKPLNLMGASIKANNGYPPLKFPSEKQVINGIQYFMPISTLSI